MFNFNGNIENQADELMDKLDMNRKKYIFNNDLVHNKSDSIFEDKEIQSIYKQLQSFKIEVQNEKSI